MNICFYADTFFPLVGGAEMVLHNLASKLTKWGETVHVLAPTVRSRESVQTLTYPVHRYPKPFSKRFGTRQVLIPLVWLHLRHRFDVLHCHAGYPPGYVGASFKKIFRIPMVVRPHGSDIVPGGRIRANARLEKRLKRALKHADAVVAQGRYMKDLLAGLGVDEGSIRVIHNGVDTAAFSSGRSFPHPRPYALSLGNLIPRKGFDILLRAYAALEGEKPDLLIAGPGPEESRLKSMAGELAVEDRVRFLGFVGGREKTDLLCSAEFFVCPSRKEPFANVILEALAAGLPVVASDVDGNPEMVHHERNGLLFPSGDHEALTRALERMVREKALVSRLRDGVPAFIRDFDWDLIASRYLALYREVASRVRRSSGA